MGYRASDPESGIASYRVGDYDGEPEWARDLGLATQTRVGAYVEDDTCGGGGSDLVFYAFNGAGSYTESYWTSSRLSVLQDDETWWPGQLDAAAVHTSQGAYLAYSGNWAISACTCWSHGTTRKTTQSGASARIYLDSAYNGNSGIAVVMAKGPDRGRAAIFVNGARVATVDTYSATKVNRSVVWRQALPSGGPDTEVEVVNLATSGRPRIDVDAFVLLRK